jgi:hypothetical protein
MESVCLTFPSHFFFNFALGCFQSVYFLIHRVLGFAVARICKCSVDVIRWATGRVLSHGEVATAVSANPRALCGISWRLPCMCGGYCGTSFSFNLHTFFLFRFFPMSIHILVFVLPILLICILLLSQFCFCFLALFSFALHDSLYVRLRAAISGILPAYASVIQCSVSHRNRPYFHGDVSVL